jgi:hypothetical protein
LTSILGDSLGIVDVSLADDVGLWLLPVSYWLDPVSRFEKEHEVNVSATTRAHKTLREDMFTA